MSFTFFLGIWLGILQLPDANLPFQFEFAQHDGHPVMIIKNAEERIVCDEITLAGDSIFIRLPLYDSEFRLKAGRETMHGVWINKGRKVPAVIPFTAQKNLSYRFLPQQTKSDEQKLTGRWETWFNVNSGDSSLAIGVFEEKEGIVTGTFLTESGDHRFLEGIKDGDSLKLSVFDGSHAWLYLAKIKDGKMEGMFYSGNHHKAPFCAGVNDSIRLRDPSRITQATGKINFHLPDPDSQLVSLDQSIYRNRVIIVQIMGTWCPNCMDESVFLDSVYRDRGEEGLEVIGLAFERTADFSIAANNVRKVKKRLNLNYPVVIAGVAQKDEVQKIIPAISNFFSYPTTLFIDRKGTVVKVSSGFSGPATGEFWLKYKKEFNRTLDRLLH